MAAYHINPANGEAGSCRAEKGRCPFGSAAEHYPTIEDARLAYEGKMKAFPARKSMKLMDAADLKSAVLWEADLSPVHKARLASAIELASVLHDRQIRKSAVQGRVNTPYVEHPLRNTLRLVRMGVKDVAVLEAAVLHDTVEDCGDRFQEINPTGAKGEAEEREALSAYIGQKYSDRTKVLVLGVTNPLHTEGTGPKTREEKHRAYAVNVDSEVAEDPDVFLVKFVDFVDNAGSLHHSLEHEVPKAQVQAQKYLPLIEIFDRHLTTHEPAFATRITREAVEEMRERLRRTEVRLARLLAVA